MGLHKFYKYQGAGNDFILFEDFEEKLPPFSIPKLCHRRLGIGADGLLIARRSKKGDFTMLFYNSDGSEGTMCGNGLRCFVHFLLDLGISQKIFRIEVCGKVLTVKTEGSKIFTYLQKPDVLKDEEGLFIVDTGTLHGVVFAEDEVDVEKEGQRISQQYGVNVNFVWARGEEEFSVRTYEKGVEGETLACGTGAAAVAYVAHEKKKISKQVKIHTRSSEILNVRIGEEIEVLGPSKRVFEGLIQL